VHFSLPRANPHCARTVAPSGRVKAYLATKKRSSGQCFCPVMFCNLQICPNKEALHFEEKHGQWYCRIYLIVVASHKEMMGTIWLIITLTFSIEKNVSMLM
jgi:hypothetical protein